MPELYDQLKDVSLNVTFGLEGTLDKTICYMAGTCIDPVYDIDWRYVDKSGRLGGHRARPKGVRRSRLRPF